MDGTLLYSGIIFLNYKHSYREKQSLGFSHNMFSAFHIRNILSYFIIITVNTHTHKENNISNYHNFEKKTWTPDNETKSTMSFRQNLCAHGSPYKHCCYQHLLITGEINKNETKNSHLAEQMPARNTQNKLIYQNRIMFAL